MEGDDKANRSEPLLPHNKKMSYKYMPKDINGSVSSEADLATQGSTETPEVQVDEQCFDQDNRKAFESLKKLRKTRMDQAKVKEVSDKAFQIIENRDKVGLIRFLDQNASVPIIDIVDARGYTLLHMACFKNLEEIGTKIMDRAQ